MIPVLVVSPSNIGCAKRGAETIGKSGQIPIRNESISKGLLLLFRKGEQSRLMNFRGLYTSCNRIICRQRRFAARRLAQHRERRKAIQNR